MEKIKKPTYAYNFGNGRFSGMEWECIWCGAKINTPTRVAPDPHFKHIPPCPETKDGAHKWAVC